MLSLARSLSARLRPIGLLIVLAVVAWQPSPATAADAAERIDALLAKYQEFGLFTGAALVADQGRVVLKKGYGLANMEWGIANTPDTKFRLGSLTKQFTATLILQLVEQGQIDLAAPITRYLPDYPANPGNRITIHQLLNHTSGIPGYTELPTSGATVRETSTPTALLNHFSHLDLLFEPGTKWSYNNSGYLVLGAILEKVTGKPYEILLRERIFTPAGMNESGYDSTQPLLARRAAGYDKRFDGSYMNTGYIDMTQPYAAGALYSTVEDLYRWDQVLLTDRVLSARSKERMFTPGLSDYGYGWYITKRDRVTTIEHTGSINGFNTVLSRTPDSKRVIILLNNTGGAPFNQMLETIRTLLDGKEVPPLRRPSAPTLFKTYSASGLSGVLAQAKEMQAGAEYDAGSGELSRLANQLLATGRTADALALAQRLADESPTSETASVLLARAHRASGHRLEAVQAYARAIAVSDTPRQFLIYTDAIRQLSSTDPKATK